jgi:CubicO group peptidase (beta-lactamase class C family)
MQRYLDGNLLSGFSSAVLVGRDLVDVKCIGWADKEASIPLRVDHIFRVFSNTKLVTSCAALLLFEDGRFKLADPIEQFIPQLANRRVLRPGATSLDQTEPAVRPITIRHLMSHSAGLSYGLLDPGTLIFNAYNERKVINPATTLAEMMDVLADLPLVYQPGTSWEYSVAIDVLARLVEVISGQRFGAFIASRILGPLGMADTGFVVSDRNRLVAFYAGADPLDPMKPGLTRADDAPYPGAYLHPFPRQNGGGGLVSTLPDSADPRAFCFRPSGCARRALLGRTRRHAMVDFAEKEHRRRDHGPARDGLCSPICGRVQAARVRSGEAQALTAGRAQCTPLIGPYVLLTLEMRWAFPSPRHT